MWRRLDRSAELKASLKFLPVKDQHIPDGSQFLSCSLTERAARGQRACTCRQA